MNAIATSLLIAAVAVRNPFWPIGFDGVKEAISAEPRVEVAAATAAGADESDDDTATAGAAAQAAAQAELDAHTVSPRNWAEARKTLRISGTTTVTDRKGRKRHSVIINGLIYADGDLISINHDGHRFTWRVKGLTEGSTLRLYRIRAKEIDDEKGEPEK